MTAALNRHARRFRLSEALHRLISERGPKRVGEIIGLARENVSDRGGDLHKWRVDELLDLSEHAEEIETLGLAALRRDNAPVTEGSAVAAHSQVMADIGAHARITALEARIIGDGNINDQSRDDFHKLEAEIVKMRAAEDVMLASLRLKIARTVR